MTYRYPLDQDTSGVNTRLIEDDGEFAFAYDGGDNAVEDGYRARVRNERQTGEFRLVAHLSPGEILKLYQETGILAGRDSPEAVVYAVNSHNYARLRTIEGKIGRTVKD